MRWRSLCAGAHAGDRAGLGAILEELLWRHVLRVPVLAQRGFRDACPLRDLRNGEPPSAHRSYNLNPIHANRLLLASLSRKRTLRLKWAMFAGGRDTHAHMRKFVTRSGSLWCSNPQTRDARYSSSLFCHLELRFEFESDFLRLAYQPREGLGLMWCMA